MLIMMFMLMMLMMMKLEQVPTFCTAKAWKLEQVLTFFCSDIAMLTSTEIYIECQGQAFLYC